jgi:hypothetical protein
LCVIILSLLLPLKITEHQYFIPERIKSNQRRYCKVTKGASKCLKVTNHSFVVLYFLLLNLLSCTFSSIFLKRCTSYRQEASTKDQDSDEISIRRVKLKQKQFNGSLFGHMQNLLETDSPAHESSSRSISYTSTEFEEPNKSSTSVEKTKTNACHKRLTSLGSLINHNRNSQDTSSSDERDDSPSSELLSNSSTTQQYQAGSTPEQDTESGENSDEYISDATASEVEFLDALTAAIMDSEMETDSEVKDKKNPSMVSLESKKVSERKEDKRKNPSLLRSKSSSMRDDRDETDQILFKSVAGGEAAAATSDGNVSKSMHEIDPHYRTVSFDRVDSTMLSYGENEFNPVTTNANRGERTAKLEKDSFSHSLRHMAKQLLDLKHDLTEDEEEVDPQDLGENEELLFDSAGVQWSGIVGKGEYLIENVQNSSATEVSNDLIAKDLETIETEINSTVTYLGEDQVDLTSHENELPGVQNIEPIEIEQLNTSKEFGEEEVHISSDVRNDGEKRDELSIEGTVIKSITEDRISNCKIAERENLYLIKTEKKDSGEILHADETSAEENAEETDETLMDVMVADNLTKELHENEMNETQNLTLVDKEQELVETDEYLGFQAMQHGDKSYEISGHGTVTEWSIKEEVFYNNMQEPDNQNLSSEEREELCESEMHVCLHSLQNQKNKTEKLINDKVFDGDVPKPENLNSNEEKELYESEMYVGVGLDANTAETYELPVDGGEAADLSEAEDFDSGIAEFQNVNSMKNKEEFLENEMEISSDDTQNGKECYKMPTISTVDANLDTADVKPEILLQEQNARHGDQTQIAASEYSLDEERTLSDNSAEPWDSQVDDDLSVKALADCYDLLEEEMRYTGIEPVSLPPLIQDNILREALQTNNETFEEEDEEENKADDTGGELPVPRVVVDGGAAEDEPESSNPVPADPVTVLDTKIEDDVVTPVAWNSEVIPAPGDPATDLNIEILDEAVTSIACSEVIPDRVMITPPTLRIVPTYNTAPEGDIIPPLPPLPPLPPIQWRMGKPQMGPLPCLGPMAPQPHSRKMAPFPNFSKFGRPPRPKPSRVAARERKMHEVENELIGENCEMISDSKEPQNYFMSPSSEKDTSMKGFASAEENPTYDEKLLRYEEPQNCFMSPSLEKDTSMKGFASAEENPIYYEKLLRYEEVPDRELSVKEEPLSPGADKFEFEMEEEPRKNPPSVPTPPKYPLFQVTSHDNSMVCNIFFCYFTSSSTFL